MSTFNRAAWTALGSVFAVAALAYGTYTVVGLVAYAHEDTHVEFDAATSAGVARIEVHNDTGSARIVGLDDQDEIVVDADVTYGLHKPSNDVHIEGDTLVVRSSCSAWSNTFCDTDFVITVPSRVAVHASAAGGGLRIEGIDGTVDASSSGGGLHLRDVGGDLVLRSSGGGVTGDDLRSTAVEAGSSGGGVRLSFAEPPDNVDVGSSGGGVTIELPPPYAYDIRARSSGGGVHTSEVRHDPSSGRIIDVSSSGGGVTIRYRTD
jgi:hypothetical protein